jgi:hypothetical protein
MEGEPVSEPEWRACFRIRKKIDYVQQRVEGVGGSVICIRTCSVNEKIAHWMSASNHDCTCDASPSLPLCEC